MVRARALGLSLAMAILVWTGAVAEPPPGRQSELLTRLRHDCGSCHGLTLKGGLGPPLSPAAMAEREEHELIETILKGRPGTPMPPWDFELSHEEAAWLVRRIKEGL